MNKNDCMFVVHNTEKTSEIITSAVNAFCDLRTDACLSIDLSFEKCIRLDSLHDNFARVSVEVLKAEDYRVPNRTIDKWNDEDQHWISNNAKNGRNSQRKTRKNQNSGMESNNTSTTSLEMKSSEYAAKYIPKKVEDNVKNFKMFKARLWEIPSGEVYAVRMNDCPRRKVNFRKSKSATDVKTAQEAPAVREKGDSVDVTDNDSTLLKRDTLSKESVADETNPKSPKNPRASVETVDEPKKTTPPKEVILRPVEELNPKQEESKKIKLEEKKIVEKEKEEVKKETKTKSFEDKAVNTSPMCSPPEPFIPSIRQRSDTGYLNIIKISNGVTKFECSVQHLNRKSKRGSRKNKSHSKRR